MTLWPRSLVGRMTALVAAVGLLSFVMHLGLMALWLNSLSPDMAAAIAGRAATTRALLARTTSAERDALAAQLSGNHFRVQRSTTPVALPVRPMPPLAGRLVERMRAEAGPDVAVSLRQPDAVQNEGVVSFELTVDGEPWRITHHLSPPSQALLGTGLGWLALLAVAIFASLALGVRFIARPIAVLADKLHAHGSRMQPLPAPAGGARELRELTDAFNRLAEAVRQADDDRQHLLAGVSHDLRTPLARLKLRVETQVDERTADALLRDVDAIERIVAQFLAYSQGELQGPHTGLGEPDAVAAVLGQVVAGYSAQGHAVSAAPTAVEAELPDLALQRILTNLIDNALAHGAAPVRVSLLPRNEAGAACAQLVVSDAGAGMDEAEFQRARQPFVRLGNHQAAHGHCGLGLAIVSQLARQLGARLERHVDGEGRFGVALVWPLPPAH